MLKASQSQIWSEQVNFYFYLVFSIKIIHLLLLHCHVTVVLSKFKVMWQIFLTIFVKNQFLFLSVFMIWYQNIYSKSQEDIGRNIMLTFWRKIECLLILEVYLSFLLFLKLNDALTKVNSFHQKSKKKWFLFKNAEIGNTRCTAQVCTEIWSFKKNKKHLNAIEI